MTGYACLVAVGVMGWGLALFVAGQLRRERRRCLDEMQRLEATLDYVRSTASLVLGMSRTLRMHHRALQQLVERPQCALHRAARSRADA